MAGEAETGKETVVENQEVSTEELKGPEHQDSLASILEEAPRPVFTGHPALGEEEGEIHPEGEDKGTKPPEQTGKEEEDKKPPEPSETPKFEPKYKSHEEAERAYQEAERRMHEATTQAAKDKEALEAAERERDEIRQKLAEKEAKPPEPPAKTPEELEAEQEAKIEAALEEISGLDEGDPEYRKKVAKAWRKAGIGGSGQPAIPDAKVIEEMIDRQVAERLQEKEAAAAAQRQKDEKDRQAREAADLSTKAEDLATKAGLNMEKGNADYRLFWDVVNEGPEEIKGKPFEDQVKWVVGEVRRLKGEVAQSTQEAQKRAQETQQQNAVLERGASRPKAPQAPEPFTLGSIMDKHRAARII